jgi:hypothetical protein
VLLEGVLHKLVRHVDILETKRKHDSEARKVRYSMFIAFTGACLILYLAVMHWTIDDSTCSIVRCMS